MAYIILPVVQHVDMNLYATSVAANRYDAAVAAVESRANLTQGTLGPLLALTPLNTDLLGVFPGVWTLTKVAGGSLLAC
jgi:hypothetical protein